MKIRVLQLLAFALILSSCGGGETSSESTEAAAETATTETSADVPAEVTLELASNDQMQFDKDILRVKAGQKVTLTLTHTGQMEKTVMGHNFVLLKEGTNVTEFASAAVSAKDTEYIPEGDDVIANTSIIGGGESVTITFDAPAAGIYDYICSFPGHYSIMRGKFIVE